MTEQEIEAVAEKAADKAVKKAMDQIYVSIGKGVVVQVLKWIGMGAVVLAMLASFKGWK